MVLIGGDNEEYNINWRGIFNKIGIKLKTPFYFYEEGKLKKDLKQRLKEKGFPDENTMAIVKSFSVAAYIHRGEKRKSRKDYIEHPYKTALGFIDLDVRDGDKLENILTMLIMGGFLHDSDETLMNDNKGKTKEECLEYIIKKYNGRFSPHSKHIEQDISDLTEIGKDYVAYMEGMKDNINALLIKSVDNRANLLELKSYSPEEKLVPTFKGILVNNTLKYHINEKKKQMGKNYLEITKKVIGDSGDYAIMVLNDITKDILDKYKNDQEFKKELATIDRYKTDYVRWSTVTEKSKRGKGAGIFDGILLDFINIIRGRSNIEKYFKEYGGKEKDKEIYKIASFLKREYSKLLKGGFYIKGLEPDNLKKFEEKIKEPKNKGYKPEELVYHVS
ncbi:MAG: hypothetical protein KKE93_03855 [Nanoarchaeota archaeon]|nr:hypothetical protein [Nanoarchaeota archaeon]